MGRSLRVSEAGLKRAKDAFHRTGWTREYLAGSVKCSRQTVWKFFAGGDIEKRVFEALCCELNLKVAEIADFESEEGLVNTSVSVNGNREQSLGTLTQKPTETDEEKVSFSILGTASKVDLPKLKAIVAHLQKITGDTSIEIVDIEEGSIRLILEGSQESLKQIEELFKSGHLTEVEGIPVENVQFVAPKIPEHDEDRQAIDKKRLAFTLASSVSSEEIEELKAAFTETLDNDEEIETDNKARLVREIITQGVKGRNLRGADLRGANLRSANLRSADLRSADLRSADLRSADLSSADLSSANLSSADLSSADLSFANLSSADLSSANLSSADLSFANLSFANLSSADLSDANLRGADLIGARIDAQTKIDSKWRLVWEIVNQGARERDLIGIDLRSANLSSADLSSADLSSADLSFAKLIGANLRSANLIGAKLRSANLRGANLSSADLSSASLSSADLHFAKLIGAKLRSANLRSANLRSADLSDANLSDADLIGADLSDANLSGGNLSDANLSGGNLSGGNLSGGNLSGADLRSANLSFADLSGADLSGAVVENARFGANLGLTEEMKLDLKRRGAIFEDSPGDRSGVLSRR